MAATISIDDRDVLLAIDANHSLSEAWARMNAAEVRRAQSRAILA